MNFSILLVLIVREWRQNRLMLTVGALSFFALFSAVPMGVLLIGLLGKVISHSQAMAHLDDLMESQVAETVRLWLAPAMGHGLSSLTLFSIGMLLSGAYWFCLQLRETLDCIAHVPPVMERTWKQRVRVMIRPLVVILLGFLLIVTLVGVDLSRVVAGRLLEGVLAHGAQTYLWKITNAVLTLAVFTYFFAGLYKWVPDVRQSWADVMPGALASSTLFTVTKAALSIYFSWFSVHSLYGAAGSVIVVMMWVYISAQIFCLGAVLNFVHRTSTSSSYNPSHS